MKVCGTTYGAARTATFLRHAAATFAGLFLSVGVASAQEATTASTTQPTTAPTIAPSNTAASASDVQGYPVSRFLIHYVTPRVSTTDPRPAEDALLDKVTVTLGEVDDGYVVAPGQEADWLKKDGKALPPDFKKRTIPTVKVRLADVAPSKKFYASAIWSVDEQVRKSFAKGTDLLGVFVIPSPADISVRDVSDLRTTRDDVAAKTSLELWIFTGTVSEVRTIASGTRVKPEARINSPVHAWIREHSPVLPAPEVPATTRPTTRPASDASAHFLRRDLLDDYVAFLNRHPGRHVDVAVSGIDPTKQGAVSLDYLVTESRPWSVYTQISNTGTKETDEWRERFGYVNNQLFNHDDTLNIDYTTAAFRVSQDIAVSYETPIIASRKLRARFYGDYDEFTASDVGFGKQQFDGEQYSFGAELSYPVFQRKDLFVDLVAGARYEDVSVHNKTVGASTSGSATFAVPYIGARLERITDIASTTADATLSGRFTNSSQAELNKLGRLNSDQTAIVLQAGVTESFFLEPLLDPKAFREARGTLAHEMVLSVRGQYAFDYRLIPQAEDVAGGLYTVRGYDESIASGDSVILASAEYRFHLPRSLTVVPEASLPGVTSSPMSRPFRFRPQAAYGRPDWDLVFKGFLDAGQTFSNNKQSFERNDTLVGTGIGVEYDYKQNFSVRLDWGFPLSQFQGGPSVGESRVHLSATFLY